MSASQILRRAAQLVAAGWSPLDKPLDATGERCPIFGGTVGDTARAGVNKAIAYHTLYSAIVQGMNEADGSFVFAPVWECLSAAIQAQGYTPGGHNYLHPAIGFNTAEGRTAEQVQALLNQVADQLDPQMQKPATPLPPVTL